MFPVSVRLLRAQGLADPLRRADLKGKAIAYGYTTQEIIKTVVDGLLANAGLTAADVKPVLV